jgi:malate dehydrogenase (oxaloacetate-decarboxylating)(NADP+)
MSTQKDNIPRGVSLLHDPLRNKGTAFTEVERDALGLRGLLPPHIHTQDEQMARFLAHLRGLPDTLEQFVALSALHDRNEALFFRVVCDNVDEIMPLIYTPTVGLACQRFGHIFQRPRGMFISINDRGRIAEILRNWPHKAGIIVVTDGERILGLGDQGANGMGIPVGKLSLYTACAGVDPAICLPVTLDMGTNNETLLADPYYVGLRRHRVTGPAYDELIDEFVTAAREVFPDVIIQFEDFANHNAFRLLEKYRNNICTFNDDIQGTASVALAGVFSALRVKGTQLADETFLFLGAGEAATGIADLIVAAMVAQGIDQAEARKHCWLVDSKGLVVKSREGLAAQKLPYAHEHAPVGDFLSALKDLKPTAIIGVAAVGGTFTPEVLRAMADLNERPIVFALSNPTSKAECTAEQAYQGTDGRALFACGSPFLPVEYQGRRWCRAKATTPTSSPASASARSPAAPRASPTRCSSLRRAHAGLAGDAGRPRPGQPVPAAGEHPQVSAHIAVAVAEVAYERGLAARSRPEDMMALVQSHVYDPHYPRYA